MPWETVVGSLVEAGMNVKMPEHVEFVGNWGVIELN
jgi:hypothetical protein